MCLSIPPVYIRLLLIWILVVWNNWKHEKLFIVSFCFIRFAKFSLQERFWTILYILDRQVYVANTFIAWRVLLPRPRCPVGPPHIAVTRDMDGVVVGTSPREKVWSRYALNMQTILTFDDIFDQSETAANRDSLKISVVLGLLFTQHYNDSYLLCYYFVHAALFVVIFVHGLFVLILC